MKLTIHPDAREWDWCKETDSADLGVADMPRAMHTLRAVFADHRMIATLGAIEIAAAPGAESALPAVHARLGSFLHDIGNSIPDCWLGARQAMQNLAVMQNEPKTDAITGIYNGTVICIASGPSNAQWLELIRELQDKCVIVCADSMWKGLRTENIDPHFVCVLERDPLLASLVTPDPTSRARLVIPAVAYPETITGWEGRRIWWWQTYADLYRWIAPDIPQHPTGRSAGTMAVALSILLGARRVYLVGHDLCRGSDGSSHSSRVDSLASKNHAIAATRREPLHDDIIINGKRTCLFWSLVHGDLEALAQDNPGILHRLGGHGLDIAGVPRCVLPEIIGDPYDQRPLNATPSRAPVDLKSTIKADIASWESVAPKAAALAEQSDMHCISQASLLVNPDAWASPDTAGIYKYVMGPAFRAASLRAFIRSKQPYAHRDAFRILLRTIPATLAMMEREA